MVTSDNLNKAVRQTDATQPLLSVRNLDVRFRSHQAQVHAVRGVSFDIFAGETLAIVGESGSGKSVTARAIMRLLPGNATVGEDTEIRFDDEDLLNITEPAMRGLRSVHIAMIFQEPMSSLNPVYTIGHQIIEVIITHRPMTKKAAMAEALELLQAVQIPDPEARLKQYPHQLSGGQRQRVMIAIAIANKPDLLIADEPTTALDVTVQAEILQLLARLQQQFGLAIMLITHDLTVVRAISDRVIVMRLGEHLEVGTTNDVFNSPSHPYTRQLIASEPKGDPVAFDTDARSLLQANDVRVEFSLGKRHLFTKAQILVAVGDVSVSIRRGETVGIVGESGSGKTTLGKSLIRLIGHNAGEIVFDGQRIDDLSANDLKPLRQRMQIVFQDPFASLNPRMSVKQLVAEGLVINDIGNAAERHLKVEQALVEAGLDGSIMNRFPHEFSGGQRQRIAIARAIVMRPEFILLDEPTSALDLTVQAQIIDLLRQLQTDLGLSYLFISHDLKVVRALCHRIIVMKEGRMVETGLTHEVMESPSTEYMRTLMHAAFEVAA